MENGTQPQYPNREFPKSGKKQGCAIVVGYIAWSLWIVIICVADILFNWETEQVLFEASEVVTDMRWLNHLTFSMLLFIPLLIGFFAIRSPRLKSSIQVWMLAAGFALATVPIKMIWITNGQEVAVAQTGVLLLFAIILYLARRKHRIDDTNSVKGAPSIIGLVVLMAGLMTVPWVLFGALGSATDTLLYICLGIAFAYFMVEIIYPYLFQRTQAADRELHTSDFLLDGFVAALFFLITLTGLSQNGSQFIQMITLPASGWVISFFAMLSRNQSHQGKLYTGLISAAALVMPVIWFDADELSLVVSGSAGGATEWALKAAWFTLCVPIFIFVVNLIHFQVSEQMDISKKVNLILCGITVLGLAGCYSFFGRTGFHGEKVFVILRDQADLSQAENIENVDDRRAAVYTDLVKTADDSQADIRSQLESWHLKYTSYYLVNGLEVDSNPIFTMLIKKRSDVAEVLDSPQLRPLPEKEPLSNSDPVGKPAETPWNLTMIGVDKVQSELKITGSGIVIGQTDSGVDGNNEELSASYRGRSGSNDYNWLDPWNGTSFPTDTMGHGTAGLGIMVGKDIGIAPDAQWIGCVNLARNLGNPAEYLNCMQFMLAPYPQGGNAFTDGDPGRGAMIINNSWGCPKVEGCSTDTFTTAVNALETAGIFVTVSAGNTGYYGCSSVTDPLAIYADAFTVGSIDKDGNVSGFSSLGPVTVDGSGRVKPDLLAPGEDIVLAFPDDQYMQASGTSFSAPHVSGVVALMWSANPALIGNIPMTREILEETATPYKGTVPECSSDNSVPNNVAGYGIVNAYAAVQKALEWK